MGQARRLGDESADKGPKVKEGLEEEQRGVRRRASKRARMDGGQTRQRTQQHRGERGTEVV